MQAAHDACFKCGMRTDTIVRPSEAQPRGGVLRLWFARDPDVQPQEARPTGGLAQEDWVRYVRDMEVLFVFPYAEGSR
jgi:hypothetical protein